MQAAIERITQGKAVWTLSLDIAVDAVRGDLSQPTSQRAWLARIWQGQVIMVMAGPPCETWSSVRRHELPDGGAPTPRPLRTTTHLWGDPKASGPEWEQITIGNDLYRIALLFCTVCHATGTSAALEYPADPVWYGQQPSSWKLPECRWLIRQDGARTVTIDQCMWGARYVKPTTSLTVHLAELAHHVDASVGRGRCNHGPGAHGRAVGRRRGTNVFKTAQLKEYPPALCTMVAECVSQHWSGCMKAQTVSSQYHELAS